MLDFLLEQLLQEEDNDGGASPRRAILEALSHNSLLRGTSHGQFNWMALLLGFTTCRSQG